MEAAEALARARLFNLGTLACSRVPAPTTRSQVRIREPRTTFRYVEGVNPQVGFSSDIPVPVVEDALGRVGRLGVCSLGVPREAGSRPYQI